jgi:hypothetical protein
VTSKPFIRLNLPTDNVDQIWQFLTIGLLLVVQFDKIDQRYGDILGYFLLRQKIYMFTRKGSLDPWFDVSNCRFQKWFDVVVLNFKIQLFLAWQVCSKNSKRIG